jgi:heme A synthase
MSAGVIALQIVLGAITVLTNNAPITVALHLLVAALFLAVVTVTAVASFIEPDRSWSLLHRPGRLAWVAVGGLYLVVISGSIVVNAGAQSACTSWPACFSSPATMGLVVIQLVHRSMVLVGSLLVVAFLVSVWRKKGTDPVERNLSLCAIALLAAQIVVGALSALYSSHSEFADVHLALASALWVAVVAVFALSARERPVGEPNPLLGDHFPSDPPVSHVLR